MKKEFLDYLYSISHLVQDDIKRLVKLEKQPQSQCCDKMLSEREVCAELRTRRSQLSSIDETILKYINIHVK